MPYEELRGWFQYFERRPPGWREDQRAGMLLQAQGAKQRMEDLFPSLAAIKRNNTRGIKGSAMEKLIANSVGGERIPL